MCSRTKISRSSFVSIWYNIVVSGHSDGWGGRVAVRVRVRVRIFLSLIQGLNSVTVVCD